MPAIQLSPMFMQTTRGQEDVVDIHILLDPIEQFKRKITDAMMKMHCRYGVHAYKKNYDIVDQVICQS